MKIKLAIFLIFFKKMCKLIHLENRKEMQNEQLIKSKMKICIKNISKRVLKLSSEQHKNLNLGSN
jgi:hypothetical protein